MRAFARLISPLKELFCCCSGSGCCAVGPLGRGHYCANEGYDSQDLSWLWQAKGPLIVLDKGVK